jgi:chemotaxis protein MotB
MSGGGGSDSRWLITYGDLVTLLMAFFIALYGISHSDQKKFQEFLKGLGPFGNAAAANTGILKGGPSIVGAGTGVGNAKPGSAAVGASGVSATGSSAGSVSGAATGTALSAATKAAVGAATGAATGPVAGAATGTAVGAATGPVLHAGQSDLAAVAYHIQQALQAQGLGSAVTFTVESRGLVATIATDHVLFDTGSAHISASGERLIAAIAPTIARLSNPVLIEGHTDNVPLNSNGYTNWNLSTDRAVAVLQIFQSSFGIAPARLSGAGYGEYHPAASDATPEGRAANRRVEIVILTDAPTTPKP